MSRVPDIHEWLRQHGAGGVPPVTVREADYGDFYNAGQVRARYGLPEAQTDADVWQALEREHELPEVAAKLKAAQGEATKPRTKRKPVAAPIPAPKVGGDEASSADDETIDSDVRISMMLADRMAGSFLYELAARAGASTAMVDGKRAVWAKKPKSQRASGRPSFGTLWRAPPANPMQPAA